MMPLPIAEIGVEKAGTDMIVEINDSAATFLLWMILL